MNRDLPPTAPTHFRSTAQRSLQARRLVAFAFIALIACNALAQDRWTLLTGDFDSRVVALKTIDSQNIATTDGKEDRSTPVAQFMSLTRTVAKPKITGRWILMLANGDQLIGEPVSTAGETITWKSSVLGELPVSLRQARAIVPGRQAEGADLPMAQEDAISLNNGDRVSGVITRIDSAGASVQSAAGLVDVPIDTIASVSFAAIEKKRAATKGFRVTLADGSQFSASGVTVAGNSAAMTGADGKERTIDLASIYSIEQLSGPVVWLSMVEPSSSTQTPYLDAPFPSRIDRTVSGGAIRFKDRTFVRGIGMHSKARMTWKLSPEFIRFRTQYAIDGDRPMADVTVRILVDDKVVHEMMHVRSGALAAPVIVDLNNAGTLALEVDYGDGLDVQDHLNWIEPALIRATK
jgi:hypothetical protein